MQVKQRVHLPMIKTEFGKHSYTLIRSHLKYNPRIITSKILHESSVARFPANKFAPVHADY